MNGRLLLFPLVLSAVAGAATALQSAANGALGTVLGSPAIAALWSFGSGLAIVTAIVLSGARSRQAMRRLYSGLWRREFSLLLSLGGVIGAFLVAVQAFVVPHLGVALSTIAIIAGNVTAANVVDWIGFGPGRARRPAAGRLAGSVLIIGAVVVSSGHRLGGGEGGLWLAVLPFAAGFAMAFQQAANGRVRAFCGDSMTTTFNNFFVGTAALAALVGVMFLTGHRPSGELPGPADWWMLTGGALGVAFIAVAAAIVAQLGVLLMGLGNVFGQLFASLAMDAVIPHVGATVTWWTVAGVLMALVGMLIASLPGGRRGGGRRRMLPLDE